MKYFIYFALIFSLGLMYLVFKKQKKEETKMGCLSNGFIFLSVFSLSALFFPFTGLIIKEISDYLTKTSYEATIIESKAFEIECEDYDGNAYICIEYSTYVEFQLEDKSYINITTNTRSGQKPVTGNTIKILYKPGNTNVNEVSWKSFFHFLGKLIILFFIGTFLLVAINYSQGKSNKTIGNMFTIIFTRIVIPAALLGFIAMFIWELYKYSKNIEPYSIWGIIMIFIFLLLLIPTTFGYIKNSIGIKRNFK